MKFPKMVKHLLAGEKITREYWIKNKCGYIVLDGDKILSMDVNGDAECEWNCDSRFSVNDIKEKGWKIYNESD